MHRAGRSKLSEELVLDIGGQENRLAREERHDLPLLNDRRGDGEVVIKYRPVGEAQVNVEGTAAGIRRAHLLGEGGVPPGSSNRLGGGRTASGEKT